MDPSDSIHKSKVDRWIYFVLIGPAALVIIYSAAQIINSPQSFHWRMVLEPILGVGLMLFVVPLMSTISYRVTASEIKVRAIGIPCGSIAIKDITAIVDSHNPLSAPAASLDRLRISTSKSRLAGLVSPQDKLQFLRDIAARDPGLEVVNVNGKWSLHRDAGNQGPP